MVLGLCAAGRGQSSEVQASWLLPRGHRSGVTGADCGIWIELDGGGSLCLGVVARQTSGEVMDGGCRERICLGIRQGAKLVRDFEKVNNS